jgi:hypothetical protein
MMGTTVGAIAGLIVVFLVILAVYAPLLAIAEWMDERRKRQAEWMDERRKRQAEWMDERRKRHERAGRDSDLRGRRVWSRGPLDVSASAEGDEVEVATGTD